MAQKPILEFVRGELDTRKGGWRDIAKAMEPDAWQSYYSWLTKLAQGKIPDPGVNKIQALADYFRGVKRAPATVAVPQGARLIRPAVSSGRRRSAAARRTPVAAARG